MAFGIPGSEDSSSSGPFLDRIQFDARVGYWKIVKRVQGPDGWHDETSDPFKNATFCVDFGSLEVGYIKYAKPPVYLVVPYGQPIPPQPQEMMTDPQGRQRIAFLPGFRVKVASKQLFGDASAYYFSSNSKNVIGKMDVLFNNLFTPSPEATKGLVPLVEAKTIEVPGQQTKFYAPEFTIKEWFERIPSFGERTVPAPGVASPGPRPKTNGAGAQHVPPPAQAAPASSMPSASAVPDEMPF